MNVIFNAQPPAKAGGSAEERVGRYNWGALGDDLDAHGNAILKQLLTADECANIAALYPHEEPFRSRVIMARHGFGKGEYRYFKYPLPALIGDLRTALYPRLAGVANAWNERMGQEQRFPETHAPFLKLCHDAGQTRPTPLLLQYVPGDFNALHQDLYGDIAFPIQVAILLSEPDRDFTGGEFVLTEQRPRMQSRVEVVPLRQGDAVAFAVHNRPVRGAQRQLPRQPAARRQPAEVGSAPHARHHLPRREVASAQLAHLTQALFLPRLLCGGLLIELEQFRGQRFAQARNGVLDEAPRFQGHERLSGVNEMNWDRLGLIVLQDDVQFPLRDRLRHLVRQHVGDADTRDRRVYGRLGGVYFQPAQGRDCFDCWSISRAEDPCHPGADRGEGHAHVVAEVGGRFRGAVGREIGGAAADDAPYLADLRRDHRAVGQVPNTEGEVDMLVDKIQRRVGERQLNVDLRDISPGTR